MTAPWRHLSVLLQESIDAVLTDPSGTYIDATYGRGGHTALLLSRLTPQGRLIAFDRDPQAVADAQLLANQDARFSIQHAAFSQMEDLAPRSVTGILMDIGISSPQVDDASRGFSFMRDGPLDMRMDPTSGESLAQWLDVATTSQIAQVIHDYGEERHARDIAAAIVARRQSGQPVTRTADLAELVARAVRKRQAGQHPATRTFQAFRIFINDELGELGRALIAARALLVPQGRLAVISFHSLEDRCVKQFIAAHSKESLDPRSPQRLIPSASAVLSFKDLGRIKPSPEEIRANPRSRSAVLRVAERTSLD